MESKRIGATGAARPKRKDGRYPIFRIAGRTGAVRWSPWTLRDEFGRLLVYTPEKLSWREMDEMRFYPPIRAGLALMKLPILQTEWDVVCQDADIAAFVKEALRPIWKPLLRGLLLAFDFGHVVLEKIEGIVYGIEVTQTQALAPSGRKTVYQRAIVIRGFLELDPTTYYLLADAETSEFRGVQQFLFRQALIPEEKCVYWANEVEYGELYGRPVTKPCYPFWFFAKLMHQFANVHYETFADPVKVIYYPPGQSEGGVDDEGNPIWISNADYALKIAEDFKQQTSVALPNLFDSEGHRLWEVIVHPGSGGGEAFIGYIDYLNRAMLRAMFVPQLAIETADTGTYNLGVGQINLFLTMVEAKMQEIFHAINRQVVEPLVRKNFGARAPQATIVAPPLRPQLKEAMHNFLMQVLMERKPVPIDVSMSGEKIYMAPDWTRIAEMAGIPVKFLTETEAKGFLAEEGGAMGGGGGMTPEALQALWQQMAQGSKEGEEASTTKEEK